MATSLLQQLIGLIESSNNPNIGITEGTIGGIYQQSLGFQQQYGGNTTGATILDPNYQAGVLNSYVSAAIANNPNITVGDLYAGYNLGTGIAGNPGLNYGMLPGAVQSNVANAANSLGVDLNAPAASYFDLTGGGGILPSGTGSAEGFGTPAVSDGLLGSLENLITGGAPASGTETFVGGPAAAAGAAAAAAGGGGGGGGLFGDITGLLSGSGGAGIPIGVTPGLATGIGDWVKSLGESVVQGFDSLASGLLGGATNWIVRGFIILIAIVLIGVALAALMFKSDTVKRGAALAAA